MGYQSRPPFLPEDSFLHTLHVPLSTRPSGSYNCICAGEFTILAAALTALTALQSVDFRCAAGSAVALARWPADLSLARDGCKGKGA
jgi:hypothetical protein